jgi:ectoine hydroxylase-related dioxygenase (phytanoyl-CoA dioxygenase family)
MNDNAAKNVLYPELLKNDTTWGKNHVILYEDINLLENTDFDDLGFKNFDIDDFNHTLIKLVKETIYSTIGKNIELDDYHKVLDDMQHTRVINNMQFNKKVNADIYAMCSYLEEYISKILKTKVKIFNDDLWIRICRPKSDCDFNPCHRDNYLEFYKNVVNIYLPIYGSNELSSLKIQPGSHKWSEDKTIVTHGGAYFESIDKKYSVSAIIASKNKIEMLRPNPNTNQMMLFSPYLIHGCSGNDNDITRFSLEVRFIENNEQSMKQEKEFNEFLRVRMWR